MVVFALVSIELVGVTERENEDLEKVIPKAINNIPIYVEQMNTAYALYKGF